MLTVSHFALQETDYQMNAHKLPQLQTLVALIFLRPLLTHRLIIQWSLFHWINTGGVTLRQVSVPLD